MKNFRELKVWEKSHDLTLKIYKTTSTFPREEMYGLTSQIRRSCSSVPTNIAEGCGRSRDTELARFLEIAMGSINELDYQLLLCHDLKLINRSHYEELKNDAVEIRRMLTAFHQKLKADC